METGKSTTNLNHTFSIEEIEEMKNNITSLPLLYGFEDRLATFCEYFKVVFRLHFPKDFRKFFNTNSWYGEDPPVHSDLNSLSDTNPEKIFWLALIENTLRRIDIYESKASDFHVSKIDPNITRIKVTLEMYQYKVLQRFNVDN